MNIPYAREVEVARELARQAGTLIMRYRGDELVIDYKAGDEPVTIADRAASDLVVRGLGEAFPDDVVISEETADDLRRLDARRVWYVDPIDGTRDFIRGREGFAVMIGLTENHRPVAGVVYQPVHDRMFWASGDTACFQAEDEAPRQLHVSSVTEAADIRLVASSSHRSQTIDAVKSALGISNELHIGSVGLKLCLIALGERDLYVNPSPRCKSWDTCATEAILHAAGGTMTNVHGEPLRYDLEDTWRRQGLVASNGALHAAVIERLAPLFPSARALAES
jgi:3'(2'), 5'-bisphosphate nucleotidase